MLGAGGTIVIPDPERTKDPAHWIEVLNTEKITVWNSVPAFVEMLVEYEEYQKKLHTKALRLILMSGDWIPVSLPGRIRNILGDVKIVALGGATEASIWSNCFEIPEQIPEEWRSIPYGKPLANQRYYILDQNMENCPDWVPGELYIAGTGVAQGYLNDKEKTDEKFVISKITGECLYCTGDTGCYWKDGNIEFLGRLDYQIKIAGYRIEIGEIETAVKNYKGINECRVVCVNRDSLVGFWHSNVEISEEEIKEHLNRNIPSYMIPRKLQKIVQFPQNRNGKIDLAVLKEWAVKLLKDMPQKEEIKLNFWEEKIREIWKEILGYEMICKNDNFFKKGGNSLSAIRVINNINDTFGLSLTINEIFKNQTLAELAEVVFNRSKEIENKNRIIEDDLI